MTTSELSDLGKPKIADCRMRYHNHKLRLVQIGDFLNIPIADTVSRFLGSQAKFCPVYGLHKISGHVVEYEQWARSEDEDRFFHYEMLSDIGGKKLDQKALTFLKLRRYLSSNEFCELVDQIVDAPIRSVTSPRVHRLGQQHYLRGHDDRLGKRRVAYILYLSPDWQSHFGGQLTLTGQDGEYEYFQPSYNSLILFDVTQHKKHHIEPITPQAGDRYRTTMSGWFLSDAED